MRTRTLAHSNRLPGHRPPVFGRGFATAGGTLWLALAALVAAAQLQAGSSPGSAGVGDGGVGPIATWVDDLIDDLEDIEDDLDDASMAIGGNQGPLSEPELSVVAAALDHALAIIDRILDPHQYPSLTPPLAGVVDSTFDPIDLQGYAQDCLDLIQDALDEARSRVVDDRVIGGHLQTIEELITRSSPHNYRTEAGIE